ncbi:Por secretion system C-terminal sorting domain-containing protein [Mesonia phycicola]|uniref:Por secretion system C-terminal sorting domain-containing protein n=1 Tax=Mesonia phycicola TaxID=579105 RepID=A0A1M6FBJ5_9FLAO|nr:T9SS type A sorting domain-containing protein [Mesonia phycicola]SHI95043.1 Por secretion system C-terminal sorting domain-containing protein [Mesonia phycicola]
MQRRMKTLVFTLLLIVGYNVQAAKNFDVAVAENQILMVELDDAQEGDMLTLLDVDGKVLFKEAHLNNKFQKSLSLELVPDGTYFLHLEDESSIYAKQIEKKNNTVTIKSDSQIFFKPNFKQVDKQVKVSFTNPDQKNIQVYIFDANGEVVTTLVNNDLVLKKTFDFSAVPAGDYMLAVFSGDRSYYRTVSTK